MAPTSFRVFILDEHQLVRRGLQALIARTRDLVVVGESADFDHAAQHVLEARADIAVVESHRGDSRGIEACRQVNLVSPQVRVLLLASVGDDTLTDAIMAGASGYIRKDVDPRGFLNAIRVVAYGHSLFDSALAADALAGLRAPAPPATGDGLTPAEQRILELIRQGKTNKQIALTLHLSPHTVKNRVTTILAKLGVERRTQAALMGMS